MVSIFTPRPGLEDSDPPAREFLIQNMALIIQTRAHAMTPSKGHEADGRVWHTLSDAMLDLLGFRAREPGSSFPQLCRIPAEAGIEFVGEPMLEALILECERIPGSEPEFRTAMGWLHAAACQAFAAGLALRCEPLSPGSVAK